MILDYDGDEFNAEIVRGLSDEFVELRPTAWLRAGIPSSRINRRSALWSRIWIVLFPTTHDRRSVRRFLHPTMRDSCGRFSDDIVYLQVHFTRIPLLSMVPSDLLRVPLRPGEAVGGCWLYSGPPEGGGKWTQSVIIYTAIHPEAGLLDRDRRGHSLNVILPISYPECDELLQEAVSARLEAGEVPDASCGYGPRGGGQGAGRGCLRPGESLVVDVCAADGRRGGRMPRSSSHRVAGDGSYVVNWGEHHFDGYGRSACWIRSPEGEWVGYLRE